jgi:hypothetical protein
VFAFCQQYTAAHAQALRQYQMQQEQLLRAQQQEQQRMQQQNVMWPVPGNYPNSDMSFRQYLQVNCESSITCLIFNILAHFHCWFFKLMVMFIPYCFLIFCAVIHYRSLKQPLKVRSL